MELNPDGTITLDFGDARVRVAPPKIGQYRRLREQVAKRDDERNAQVKTWRAEVGVPDEIPEAPTPEVIAAVNTVNRRSNEFNEDTLLAVWRLILIGEAGGEAPFTGLALDAVPTANTDDWPIELLSGQAYNQAMAHWAAVPLRSGGTPSPETNAPQP